MSSERYATIVADPPWQTRLRGAGAAGSQGPKGAQTHYPLMPLGDLTLLALEQLMDPDGCTLFLWTTSRALWEGDAYLLCAGWHVEPRQLHTWVKPGLGLGTFGRGTTEHFLVATRGSPAVDFRSIPTSHHWPKGGHSEKPGAFYELVERVSPGPYLEMFARRQRLGWDTWGNEAIQHVEIAS